MIFVGDDWAEDHHDVEILDEAGARLARRRFPEGVAGVGQLHALIAEHATEPAEVAVGIETDRCRCVALAHPGHGGFREVATLRHRPLVVLFNDDGGHGPVLGSVSPGAR